jgi:hypothetical protein
MTTQANNSRKKRGRPAIGIGVQVNVMVRPGLGDAIDQYAAQTGLKRTDAVRRLIKLGLAAYNASLLRLQDEP